MAGIPIGFQSSLVENIAMLWLQNKNPSLRRRRNLTSASDVCKAAPILGTLRSNDADGNKNFKKTIGLISKTTTLHVHHAFLYISLPVFARLRREHA